MTPANIVRRGCAIAAAALFSLSIHAQQSAPSVHDVAARVDRHYNSLHSLKAGFTETYRGMGMNRTESGTLLLLKPGKMKWDYSAPPGKIFLLDGKYAWFYTQGDSRVQRIPAKRLDDLRSPLRFLLGHTELEKEIDHLAVSPATNGGYTFAGVPKGQENRIKQLALTVTAEGVITAIDVDEMSGALTHFTFSGEQTNVAVPPSTFQFTPPPGIPVIDGLPQE
jgi:outer membrane lipoprotein carrier protein